jgi:hypothetical protein
VNSLYYMHTCIIHVNLLKYVHSFFLHSHFFDLMMLYIHEQVVYSSPLTIYSLQTRALASSRCRPHMMGAHDAVSYARRKILLFLSNFFLSFDSLSSWNRATLREQSVSASSLHWPRPRETKQIRKLAFFSFALSRAYVSRITNKFNFFPISLFVFKRKHKYLLRTCKCMHVRVRVCAIAPS